MNRPILAVAKNGILYASRCYNIILRHSEPTFQPLTASLAEKQLINQLAKYTFCLQKLNIVNVNYSIIVFIS